MAEINVHWIFLTVASFVFFPTLIGFSAFHSYLIAKNLTTIENFQRHHYDASIHGLRKRDENVFDLGWRENFRQVLGRRVWMVWLPLGASPGDGIHWDVKQGVARLVHPETDSATDDIPVEDTTQDQPSMISQAIRGRLGYEAL